MNEKCDYIDLEKSIMEGKEKAFRRRQIWIDQIKGVILPLPESHAQNILNQTGLEIEIKSIDHGKGHEGVILGLRPYDTESSIIIGKQHTEIEMGACMNL